MVATLPVGFTARMAGVVVPDQVRLTGTVWNGAADLAPGLRAEWQSKPMALITGLAWEADVLLMGPDTRLTGRAQLRPNEARLAPLQGQVSWALVDALMPGLEVSCATTADLDLQQVVMGPDGRMASGQVRMAKGRCARVDGSITDVPLPALLASIDTTDAGIGVDVTAVAAPGLALGQLLITPDDRLRVTVFAAGAAMVPGLPTGGDSQIELPLALFAP